jgi:SAM-dependent methyltransferase
MEGDAMGDRSAPETVDLTTPNVARMYDYYLGGKDNFAADRDAAEQALEFAPQIRIAAQHNRAFMGRAVRHLAEAGIRQFLDIGTGLPTQSNVHEVAREAAPDARVVYVDNDPVVLAHGRAILGSAENVHIVQADLRRPEEILESREVRERLDFDRPVASLLVAIVHFLQDADDPEAIVARFREALPAGGYLVLSHVCGEALPESVPGVTEVYKHSSTPIVPRGPERIAGLFGDLELLEPGVVNVAQWRPDSVETKRIAEKYRRPYFLAGVARKG